MSSNRIIYSGVPFTVVADGGPNQSIIPGGILTLTGGVGLNITTTGGGIATIAFDNSPTTGTNDNYVYVFDDTTDIFSWQTIGALGSSGNIYTVNGGLTGNRTLAGGGYNLIFSGINSFDVSTSSYSLTTTANKIETIAGTYVKNIGDDATFTSTGGVFNINSNAYSIGLRAVTGVTLIPFGVAVGNTTSLLFKELAANGTNYVGFKGADSIPFNVTWTLPSIDGAANQYMVTNGTGVLSWKTLVFPSIVVFSIGADVGTNQDIYTGDTLAIIGGSGIVTTVSPTSPTDIITIDINIPELSQLTTVDPDNDLHIIYDSSLGVNLKSSLAKTNNYLSVIAATSSTFNVLDIHNTILVDASLNIVTLALPPAATVKGKLFIIKAEDVTNAIIIDPNTTETIDGAATLSLNIADQVVTIQSNGVSWLVIGNTGVDTNVANTDLSFNSNRITAQGTNTWDITGAGNTTFGGTGGVSRLNIKGGDVEVSNIGDGIIIKSPNGTRWRITVNDVGAWTSNPL